MRIQKGALDVARRLMEAESERRRSAATGIKEEASDPDLSAPVAFCPYADHERVLALCINSMCARCPRVYEYATLHMMPIVCSSFTKPVSGTFTSSLIYSYIHVTFVSLFLRILVCLSVLIYACTDVLHRSDPGRVAAASCRKVRRCVGA